MIVLAALALAASTCPAGAPMPSSTPQAHGAGLWIGGIAFGPASFTKISAGKDQYTGMPQALVSFSVAGGDKFHALQKGRVGKPLEIWLDSCLVSAPILQEEVQSDDVTINADQEALDRLMHWWETAKRATDPAT